MLSVFLILCSEIQLIPESKYFVERQDIFCFFVWIFTNPVQVELFRNEVRKCSSLIILGFPARNSLLIRRKMVRQKEMPLLVDALIEAEVTVSYIISNCIISIFEVVGCVISSIWWDTLRWLVVLAAFFLDNKQLWEKGSRTGKSSMIGLGHWRDHWVIVRPRQYR